MQKTFGVGAASVPHNKLGKEHMLLYATSGQVTAPDQRPPRYEETHTPLSGTPNHIGSQTVLDNY